jgi:AAA15 family ATPase/GTPase
MVYKSFSIKNFRNIRELNIDGFKKVNIITGKNNAGKTALLEAIFLHCGSTNPSLTLNLSTFRGFPGMVLDWKSIWSSLFYNFDVNSKIELNAVSFDGSHSILKITLEPASESIYSKESIKESVSENIKNLNQSLPVPLMNQRELKYSYSSPTLKVSRDMTISPDGFKIVPPVSNPPFPGFFIPSRCQIDPRGYAERFGNLLIKKTDYLIVDCLKILEPQLKSLSIIPIGPDVIIHADIGRNRLFPLQLLGEGMSRLAEIAIDIVSGEGGVVLIDDVDTGLHHSILVPLWDSIYKLCEKANVQLFATTHSAECLESAYESFSKNSNYDLSVYRLQYTNDNIQSIYYDKTSLKAAIETGIEVR